MQDGQSSDEALEVEELPVEDEPDSHGESTETIEESSDSSGFIPNEHGRCWGEGAARCFKIDGSCFQIDQNVQLKTIQDSLVCPISTTTAEDPVVTVDGCI
mmetsp:Transcript_36021/g.65375  ORF Transcript_36021/g.65375 Transcript_36021/m.65375 type:complete len:101 (+) Transcript_36021:61-363(+)